MPKRVIEVVVGVEERRVRLGVDVVLHVIDEQRAAERHEVVHEAVFLEVVQADDVVELVVHRLARELELLRELVLLLVIRHFLDGLGQTVEVDAHLPVDAARGGDRLERHRVRQVAIERDRRHPTRCSARSSGRSRRSCRCRRCPCWRSSSRCADSGRTDCPRRRPVYRAPDRRHSPRRPAARRPSPGSGPARAVRTIRRPPC